MQFKKLIFQSLIWRGLYFFTVLLLNILIARFFKANGSGWIFYINNLYAFILLVTSLSLESGMAFYASRKEISTIKLLNLSLAWTLVVGIAVFVSCLLYLQKRADPPELKSLFLLSSFCYIGGNMLINYGTSVFYALKNFITPNLIMISCNVMLVLLLAIILSGKTNIINASVYLHLYFLTFLLQGLILMLGLLLYGRKGWRLSLPSTVEFRKLIRYSLVAFTGNFIFFLVYRVDYWFVERYCTAVDLGNYIQVSKLGQLLIVLPSITASAVFPSVASGQKEEVNVHLKRLSRMLLLVIAIPCIVVACIGKWAFPFIFGPSFSHMYQPFLLQVPGILSISALHPLTAYYSGKDMMGVNIRGSLLALLLIITFDWMLIPKYGINMAAIVSSIGYMVFHAYVLTTFRNEYRTDIAGFFFLKRSDFSWIRNWWINSYLK